jgi:hypothetical protein
MLFELRLVLYVLKGIDYPLAEILIDREPSWNTDRNFSLYGESVFVRPDKDARGRKVNEESTYRSLAGVSVGI